MSGSHAAWRSPFLFASCRVELDAWSDTELLRAPGCTSGRRRQAYSLTSISSLSSGSGQPTPHREFSARADGRPRHRRPTVCPSLDPVANVGSRPIDSEIHPRVFRDRCADDTGRWHSRTRAIPTASTGWSIRRGPRRRVEARSVVPARGHDPVRPRAAYEAMPGRLTPEIRATMHQDQGGRRAPTRRPRNGRATRMILTRQSWTMALPDVRGVHAPLSGRRRRIRRVKNWVMFGHRAAQPGPPPAARLAAPHASLLSA